jgi:hypothetical protein
VEFDHLVHRLTTGLVRVAVAADKTGPPGIERTIARSNRRSSCSPAGRGSTR